MEAPFSHISLAHVSLPLSPHSVLVQRWSPPSDVGVKFLTLLNEFPRKGGRRQSAEGERGQKRGEIQARFQFPISASSPSALSQMYRGKKAGRGGDRERLAATRTIPRIVRILKKAGKSVAIVRVLLSPSSTASCPFKPQKQSKLNMGFQTAILAFHYLS